MSGRGVEESRMPQGAPVSEEHRGAGGSDSFTWEEGWAHYLVFVFPSLETFLVF